MISLERAGFGPVLTPAQVAQIFAVDPKTVARWSKAGKLGESFRTPGNHRRFARAAVEAALNGSRGE